MRHMKLARSGGTPACLQAAQDSDQSVVGLESSALQGLKCCCLDSFSVSIVMYSSVRSLTKSFSFMVMMLSGVSSFAFLMMEKKS